MWNFICDIFGNNYNKNQMKGVETEYFIYDNESNNKYNTHIFFVSEWKMESIMANYSWLGDYKHQKI